MKKLNKILRVTAVVAIFACIGLATTSSIINQPKNFTEKTIPVNSYI